MENPSPELTPPEIAAEEKQSAGCLHFLIEFIETVLLAVVLFFGINAVSARIRVDGNSMYPTLLNGEFVFVNRLAYKLGRPSVGDVIVFRYPGDPKQDYIKRVIGRPGDTVAVQNGKVFVNGQELAEDYIAASPAYHGNWNVPEKSLFVLGDNRNDSSDSHTWGMVPMDNVVGKAVFVYWPVRNWAIITHPDLVMDRP